MPRLRRYIVPTILLLPLIAVCAKLLLTPVWRHPTEDELQRMRNVMIAGRTVPPVNEFGWPEVFLTTYPQLSNSHGVLTFSTWHLFEDACILAAAILSLAGFLLWRHRRTGRLLRYTIVELLMIIMLAAILPAWLIYERHRFKTEELIIDHLREMHFELERANDYTGPGWLIRLWPPIRDETKLFRSPDALFMTDGRFSDDVARTFCEALDELTSIRSLFIGHEIIIVDPPNALTDPSPLYSSERFLRGRWLSQIENLDVFDASAEHVICMAVKMPDLLSIDARRASSITDDDLAYLRNNTSLKYLNLNATRITDAGLVHLKCLRNLRTLYLSGTSITDAAVDTIMQLPSIEELEIDCPGLTDEGVERLSRLPNLTEALFPNPPQISKDVLKTAADRLSQRQQTRATQP